MLDGTQRDAPEGSFKAQFFSNSCISGHGSSFFERLSRSFEPVSLRRSEADVNADLNARSSF